MSAMKLGRKPPYTESERPRLKIGRYLNPAALPPAPATVDYLAKVPTWPMYGNDSIGDCTCAGVGHMIQALTTYGLGRQATPTLAQIVAAYSAITGYDPRDPSTDQGAVLQDVLDYWHKSGIAGHKILGFASADVAKAAEIKSCLSIFGHVLIGFNCPGSAMDQFDAGQPWDVVSGSPIEGGHAVNIGLIDPAQLKLVTWAQVQQMTPAFWSKYVDEAWIVLTQEWFDAQGISPSGVDIVGLGEDYTALTGKPSPFPVGPIPVPVPPTPPVPVPVPVPPTPTPVPPAPVPSDEVFRAQLEAWLAGKPFFYKALQREARTWLG